MSLINHDDLDDIGVLSHYIIQLRGSGHFLPYDDYALLEKWLKEAGDLDSLLVILSEILPDLYGSTTFKKRPVPRLTMVDKKVCRRIRETAMHSATL